MRILNLLLLGVIALSAPSFAQKKSGVVRKTAERISQVVKVDINKASAKQLEKLHGIGPKKAAAIVAWRKKHGAFKSTDELLSVPGIGAATVLKNLKSLGLKQGKINLRSVAAKATKTAQKSAKTAVRKGKKGLAEATSKTKTRGKKGVKKASSKLGKKASKLKGKTRSRGKKATKQGKKKAGKKIKFAAESGGKKVKQRK